MWPEFLDIRHIGQGGAVIAPPQLFEPPLDAGKDLVCAPLTPGPLGVGDQADPSRSSLAGETSGPAGLQDRGALLRAGSAPQFGRTATGVTAESADGGDLSEDPLSESVAVGTGMAAGGAVGCIVGGVGGYWGASYAAGELYDWAEETFFTPLPEVTGAD